MNSGRGIREGGQEQGQRAKRKKEQEPRCDKEMAKMARVMHSGPEQITSGREKKHEDVLFLGMK